MSHTASASLQAPGMVQIKRDSTTEIAFWAWHLKVASRQEFKRTTQLNFADGMSLITTAPVDEVLTAVAIAMNAYEAVDRAVKLQPQDHDEDSIYGSRV